jgi:hypothetical protein
MKIQIEYRIRHNKTTVYVFNPDGEERAEAAV